MSPTDPSLDPKTFATRFLMSYFMKIIHAYFSPIQLGLVLLFFYKVQEIAHKAKGNTLTFDLAENFAECIQLFAH
jgi:hypothetical protein